MYRIRVWSSVRVQASEDLSLPSSSSPATILPAFPFCLSNWFKTSLRASRNRSSVKGGANNYLLRTRRRGASNIELGNRLRTFLAVRLLFAKSFSLKTRTNHGRGRIVGFLKTIHTMLAMMLVSKVAHAHRTVSSL